MPKFGLLYLVQAGKQLDTCMEIMEKNSETLGSYRHFIIVILTG